MSGFGLGSPLLRIIDLYHHFDLVRRVGRQYLCWGRHRPRQKVSERLFQSVLSLVARLLNWTQSVPEDPIRDMAASASAYMRAESPVSFT